MSEAKIWNMDCIAGMAGKLDDDSVDLLVTSIPFGALFSYSHKADDIGNNLDGDSEMHGSQFGLHMRFWFAEVMRVMRPGAIVCIHVQQLLRYKIQHGYMGMRDFRGAVVTMALQHGFQSHGEVAIVKNPQRVAKTQNLHSLMFATALRDSRQLAPAMNDYVLFFKKPGEGRPVKGLIEAKRTCWLVEPSPIIEYLGRDGEIKRLREGWETIPYMAQVWEDGGPVEKEFVGNPDGWINPDGWFTKNDWVKWAHGAWTDIMEIDTLDGFRCARESDEEKHVCPLQLEVIRRCVKLYSAPGDVVLDPFMGIGSTAWVALEQGRNAVGFELKESYHAMALKNMDKFNAQQTEKTKTQLSLWGDAA